MPSKAMIISIDPHLGLSTWRSPLHSGAFLYADVPGYRIAACEPHGPPAAGGALLREFVSENRRAGRKTLLFGLPIEPLAALGLAPDRMLHIGDLPVFD